MIKYKPKISELKKFRNILQKSIPHEDDSINNCCHVSDYLDYYS